jgi:KDO2-lipid IV(A) lauroyltransferase
MAGRKFRAFRSRLIYGAVLAVTALARRIPLRIGRTLGRLLGTLAWLVLRRHRRKGLHNIALAFPEWSEAECRRTIRAMFRHLGMCLFEIGWLPNLTAANRDKTTTFEGIDRIMELIDSGRGVIVLTAHCGNWEWLSYATGTFGRPSAVMQRERDDSQLNRWITDLRARSGFRSINRGSPNSARQMIQAVRNGGILGFVMDQNIRTESVKVPLFGRPAPTPIGPARFAIRTETLVSTALIERRPDGTHHARFLEPVQCHRDDDPVALTARVTRDIEEQIRRVPEQWVWFHDRWKERPQHEIHEAEPGRPGD